MINFTCNCIGPQNGESVCPCRVPEYSKAQNLSKIAEAWLHTYYENTPYQETAESKSGDSD